MFQRRSLAVSISLVAVVWSAALGGQAPAPSLPGTFVPDWTFKGSALTGTDQIGQATWRAENGEIIGTPTSADGGWLLINPGYQDVLFAGSYRCAAACTAGVMLRSEKSAAGVNGIFTILAGGPSAPAAVTVDPGHIGGREPLTRAGGAMLRIQPPPPPPSAGRAGGAPGGGRAAGPAPAFVSMFPAPASTAFKPNDWNTFEVLVDANVFRAGVNAPTGFAGQAIDADTGTFGPIALYVGGTGEVRFKNLALKDLQRRVTPAEKSSPRFRVQHFEDFYYGWSAAAATSTMTACST